MRSSTESPSPGRSGHRFVFLDRDGTLIEDVHHGHRVEDYRLLPGTITALHMLARGGFRFAIVTNQSGIGRGLFGWDDFQRYHGRLLADLDAAGIRVDETFVCPHRPDEGCECRKPSPYSLLRARERFGIDLAASWMIGDHVSDVLAGESAGCRSALLLTGHGVEERAKLPSNSTAQVVPTLLDAARWILTVPDRPGAGT